jgi:hypothetical protein
MGGVYEAGRGASGVLQRVTTMHAFSASIAWLPRAKVLGSKRTL